MSFSDKSNFGLSAYSILALILLPFFSSAQGEFKRGYIIKPDNLLEPAYIQVLNPVIAAQVCIYKEDSIGQVKEYRPHEILGYRFLTGESFYAGIVEEGGGASYFFLENLADGRLKLFTLFNRFFLSGENLQFTELTANTYRDVLSKYFTNCPYLNSRVSKIQFTRQSLLKAVKEYDLCMESGAATYQGRGLKVEKVVMGGYSSTAIEFDANDDYPQFSEKRLSDLTFANIGFQTWFSLPRISKRFSLRTGLLFENQKFYNVSIIEPTVYQLNLKLSQLKLPVGLQFNIMETDKFSFFISGGFSYPVITNLESTEVRDTSVGSSVYIDESVPFNSLEFRETFFGLGGMVSVFQKVKIIVDVTHNFGSGTLSSDEPGRVMDSSFKTTAFKIGFIF